MSNDLTDAGFEAEWDAAFPEPQEPAEAWPEACHLCLGALVCPECGGQERG